MNLQENIQRIRQMMGIKKSNRFNQHEHLIEIFSDKNYELDEEENLENNDQRSDVIEKIRNNDFDGDPQLFFDSINSSKKHKEMLSDYSAEDFSEMKLFKLNGYDIGYALKLKDGEYSEIVSVFNNSNVKNIGDELIRSAIKNGGCYLDHYDGFLSDFYSRHGFEEYERYEFDPQYDTDGQFEKKYGKKDIIFRKHVDC